MNCRIPDCFPARKRAARLAEQPFRTTSISLILLATALSIVSPITRSAPAQTPTAPSETAAYFEDLRGHSYRQRAVRSSQTEVVRRDSGRARRTGARSVITRGRHTSRNTRSSAYYEAARNSTRRPADRRPGRSGGNPSLERMVTDRLIQSRLHREDVFRQGGAAPTHPDSRFRNQRSAGTESLGGRTPSGFPGRLGNFGESTSGRLRPSYFSRGSFGKEDRANVRLGPIDVRVSTSTFTEYNDNILRSGTEKLSDVIVGQTLDLQARWQLSERNSIDLRVGAGIERYLQHHERAPTSQNGYDIYITPDSSLSYDVHLGGMTLNLHDRFSIKNGGRDSFDLDDAQVADTYSNAAGAALFIPVSSRVDASVGYDYVINRALDDRDDSASSNSHQFFADAGYSPDGAWRFGLQASAASTRYLEATRGDARTTNTGAYFEFPLSRFTTVRASGGYQSIRIADVDGSPGTYSGSYGRIAIANQLNRYVTQNLVFGQQADLGAFTDVSITRSAQYQIDYRGSHGDDLHLALSYNTTDDRGDSASRSTGLENSLPILEDRSNFSARAHYRRPLSRNLRASVSGGYLQSATGISGRSYTRWSASAEIHYALSDTLSAGLGYTHTTTRTPGTQGYSQNRVLFNLNYLF